MSFFQTHVPLHLFYKILIVSILLNNLQSFLVLKIAILKINCSSFESKVYVLCKNHHQKIGHT